MRGPAAHLTRLTPEDCEELTENTWKHRFKVTSKLGQGGFADVLCVKDLSALDHAQQPLKALKVLRSTAACADLECVASGRCTHVETQQAPEVVLFREARALKHARHPNVVQLHSVLHVPKACVSDSSVSRGKRQQQGGACWGLLLEYLQAGSLQTLIYTAMCQPRSCTYSQLDALQWAVDIAAAVAHLHGLSPVIIHRDLKLENIMLRKGGGDSSSSSSQAGGGAGGGSGRRLPVAKLTDFGLHVMIDRLSAPFLITTGEDGMPLLIVNGGQQQQQQLACIDPQLTASTGGSSDSADAVVVADAEARVAATAGCKDSSDSSNGVPPAKAVPQQTTLRSAMQQASTTAIAAAAADSSLKGPAKHVAFAVQQQPDPDGPPVEDAAAASDAAACSGRDGRDQQAQLQRLSPSSTSQQPQQWTRLTARTLRRLSLDNSTPRYGSSPGAAASGSAPICIPLLLQSGQYGSFVSAAVPADALADSDGPLLSLERCNSNNSSNSHGSDGAAVPGGVDGSSSSSRAEADSISGILAAANSHRDYQVNLQAAAVAAQQQQQQQLQRNSGCRAGTCSSNPSASCCPSESALAASDWGAAGGAGGCQTPRGTPRGSQQAASVKSGDWPTAASMVWDDLMEEDVDQELLLDASVPPVGCGHGGAPVPLPLSYDLTGHTGSYLYMAPEVFLRKPYNESVDVFSLGVMLYELFSKSLVIYTHTPANCPEDCERYAAKVAQGFRPKQPRALPQEIWALIEACWAQDPSARPAASQVLGRLQQLLAQAQAAEAAKGASSGLGRLFGRRSAPAATTAAAAAAAAAAPAADAVVEQKRGGSVPVLATAGGSLGSGDVKAEVIAAAQGPPAQPKARNHGTLSNDGAANKMSGSSTAVTASRAPARPEPACGCVIC